MLLYYQATGELYDGDTLLGDGWAGHGDGKNNPAMQNVHDVGPLPQGLYTLEAPITHPHLGPMAYHLQPDPSNEMYGRDGFYIHGPAQDPDKRGQESKGCIIQVRPVRDGLLPYVGQQLKVV